MEIIDNINTLWDDDLKVNLSSGCKLKIVASRFFIYAFEDLKDELEICKEKHKFHIPKQDREKNLYVSEFGIQRKNKLTQKAIAKECADWIKRKASFKSNMAKSLIQQFACSKKAENNGLI